MFKKLCRDSKLSPLLTAARGLYSVNGMWLRIMGETEIKLWGLPPINVVITKDVRHKMILGRDILQNGKAVINYPQKTLHLYDQTLPLFDANSKVVCEVRATTGHPEVDEIISDFSHIFYTKGFLNGDCNVGECTIPTGNTRPIRQKAYRTPLANRYIIKNKLPRCWMQVS